MEEFVFASELKVNVKRRGKTMMMSMKHAARAAFLALIVVSACVARAAWVPEQDARMVAEAFIANDAIGRIVLSGCNVAGVTQRGNIWVVALSPSGQVLLSRTNLADPIVGFSKNDFSEPDPDSPAYAYLAGIDASLAALELSGGTRHGRWNRLLSGGTGKRLLAADIENPDTVVIPPFLESHYNQWQPYNDYVPVYEARTNGLSSYRGRCPCGCVATAAAQGLRHFRWPARMDRVDSFNHNFTDSNKITTSFPLRFDGHLPMDWTALEDDYINYTRVCVTNYYSGGYSWRWETNHDLRGTVPEATRHPIARLIMFADVLAHMSFKSGGSSANYGTVASNLSDWYTPGTWVSATDSRVCTDIANGVPVQVTIPGHAVVGHGWANDGGNKYLYLNYGWGGSNDGYYNVGGSTIEQVYVGHYPRAKPQIDPLPKVCGTSPTLNWHFPDFYTNNLSGFTVSISRTATTPSTFLDDFSSPSGSSSSPDMYVGTDADYGYDGSLLYTKAKTAGVYTFPSSYTLTSASVMTFKLLSFSALGAVYEVQASFDGGEWETICTPLLKSGSGSSGWAKERVYLGGHGGESVRFRVRNSRNSGSYYSAGRILLDDFTVTNVLAPVAPEIRNVGKTVRSLVLNGLTAGAVYSFAVTPDISGALVEGESSEPVSTSIAGTRDTPIPGEQTYTPSTLSFSASDASGTWSYSGTVVDDTTIMNRSKCSISVAISGTLTASTSLSFGWSARNYYGNGSSDTLTAVFTAIDGTAFTVWETNNTENIDLQNVSVSLGELAGLSGKLTISYNHSGSYYVGDQYGGRLYAPMVANVLVPSVPAVEWDTETLVALGTPQILSVSPASEGFYCECGLGSTTFYVTCSESVTRLEARPSHLALVGDNDVSVMPKGKGRFSVTVTPRGITEENARSRMILTLAATDANGTATYKDLSLRFAPINVVVATETVDGIKWTYTVDNGCASIGGGSLLSPAVPTSTSGPVAIPPTLGGCPVTGIADYAFMDCRSLESVKVPASVTSIGNWAFSACHELKTLYLPISLKDNLDEEGIFGDYPHTQVTVRYYVSSNTPIMIVFDPNGGDLDDEVDAVREVNKGAAIGVLPVPTRDEYVFLGWFTAAQGGTVVSSSTRVSKDVAYYAHWQYLGAADDSTIVYELEESYETEENGSFSLDLSEVIGSASELKITVKGLPFGIKYDSKAMAIVGQSTKPGVYTATVSATNKTVKKPVTATFKIVVPNLVCDALPGLKPGTDEYGVVMCGVALKPDLIDCNPKDGWTVKVAGLPQGLKYDAKTGAISGVPTKAGTYTVTLTASKGKEKQTATITLTTEALPLWATGTFTGSIYASGEGTDYRSEYGAITMSVAANGKVSGKLALCGTNWTFSAVGYTKNYDDWRFDLTAEAKAGKATLPIRLSVSEEGAGSPLLNAWVTGELGGEAFGPSTVDLWRNVWKDKSTAAAAREEIAKWVGVYTLSMEDGGYLSMTVGKDGNVRATGKIGDGTPISATVPLMSKDQHCFVVFCTMPSTYKGGHAYFEVDFGIERGRLCDSFGRAHFLNRNPQATADYGVDDERWVDCVGAYYDKTQKLNDYYEALRFATEAPELQYTFKETFIGESGRKTTASYIAEAHAADTFGQAGSTVGVGDKGFVVAKATKPIQDKATKEWSYEGVNDGALSLSFTQATGIFKGSYTFWYDYTSAYDGTKPDGKQETVAHTLKKVSFEGVWVQGAESLRGFYLWDATGAYEDPKTGKSKTYKYKEPHAVNLRQ